MPKSKSNFTRIIRYLFRYDVFQWKFSHFPLPLFNLFFSILCIHTLAQVLLMHHTWISALVVRFPAHVLERPGASLYWICWCRFYEEKQFVIHFGTWTMNQNALSQLKSPQTKTRKTNRLLAKWRPRKKWEKKWRSRSSGCLCGWVSILWWCWGRLITMAAELGTAWFFGVIFLKFRADYHMST